MRKVKLIKIDSRAYGNETMYDLKDGPIVVVRMADEPDTGRRRELAETLVKRHPNTSVILLAPGWDFEVYEPDICGARVVSLGTHPDVVCELGKGHEGDHMEFSKGPWRARWTNEAAK